MRRSRLRRKGHYWGVVVAATVVGLAGCGATSSSRPAGPGIGDAGVQAVDVVAQASTFQAPLDAAASPDGSVFYFVATVDGGPAIVSTPSSGGSETTLAQGVPLAQPTGIAVATDGSHVYVADQQATQPGLSKGVGAILSLPLRGGGPALTVLPGSEGRAPRGLDVVNQGDADAIYFTGVDPASGAPGLFEIPAGGGTVTTVTEGAPFVAPDSVVVSTLGVAYVTDQGSGTGPGQVVQVTGGTVTPVLTGVDLGHPGGVTLIDNDALLLVSAQDPATGSNEVLFLDLARGRTAAATKVIGANKSSSGGLHRAYHAKVLAWADIQGTVYRVRYP